MTDDKVVTVNTIARVTRDIVRGIARGISPFVGRLADCERKLKETDKALRTLEAVVAKVAKPPQDNAPDA